MAVSSHDALKPTVAEFEDFMNEPLGQLVSLLPTLAVLPATETEGAVEVKGAQEWSASTTNRWIAILDGEGRDGDGTLHYRVMANEGSAERTRNDFRRRPERIAFFRRRWSTLNWRAVSGSAPPLALAVAPGQRVVIELSPDLIDWTPIYTNRALKGWNLGAIELPETGAPARFLRAKAE